MIPSQEALFERLKELFQNAQKGDKEAYARFLKEVYPYVKHKVHQKLGDLIDCDDITQECLIGLHRSMETYDPGKALKPWIHGIIKHKVADYFRLWGRRQEVDLEKTDTPVTNPQHAPNNLLEDPPGDQAWALVRQLPEPLKRAVVLTKISGLSCKEASLQEGISEAAFRKRVSRAFSLLRKEFNLD